MQPITPDQTIEEGIIPFINFEDDADDQTDPELALLSSNTANSYPCNTKKEF
ncbi:MAG: hypothetical protein WD068_03210 [Candidatus Babeliales bacterium]